MYLLRKEKRSAGMRKKNEKCTCIAVEAGR
jgi:hypothetical protein